MDIPATFRRLVASGFTREDSASLGADLADLRAGLEEIETLLIVGGPLDMDALERVVDECQLHLRGHIRSLSRTARRLLKAADRRFEV